jgi:23S rRNA (pseudouridine1915-N3)-methyltransferase
MKIRIIALGTKMPAWVQAGYDCYAKRLSPPWQLSIQEIATPKRHKNTSVAALKAQEAKLLSQAYADYPYRIALDENGKSFSSGQLASRLSELQQQQHNIAILIGGPDGFAQDIITQSQDIWSLSKLTLPHPLVRIVLAEQLYRAISILNNHPYHRA